LLYAATDFIKYKQSAVSLMSGVVFLKSNNCQARHRKNTKS